MGVLTEEENDLARICAIGPSNTRKTWWACKAAELGYNVILGDFDNGSGILRNLTPEARARIFRIDMRGSKDGTVGNAPFACLTLGLHGEIIYYSDDERKRTLRTKIDPEGAYTVMDFGRATTNDVLIVDSWTELSAQIHAYVEDTNDILKKGPLYENIRDYGTTRQLADRILSGLQNLPCHVIVIGHSEEYAKRKANAGTKDKPDQAIEWVKIAMVSVTKAHGTTLPRAMSDVLFFEQEGNMAGVYINTKAGNNIGAGSRASAPKRKKWEDFGVDTLLPPLPEISAGFTSKAVRSVNGADLLAEIQAVGNKPAVLNAKPQPKLMIGKPK